MDDGRTTRVFASASVEEGGFAPDAIAEVLAGVGGRPSVHAPLGPVNWPATTHSGDDRTDFAVLGAELRPPRTMRLAVGTARKVGSMDLTLDGIWRRTDFLVRRRDLNHIGSAPTDAVRRYSEYGEDLDGGSRRWSEYRGIQLGARYEVPGAFRFNAAYAFSQTIDNWVDADEESPDLRFSGSRGVDWDETVSDFDVPHRLVAAITGTFPSVSALSFGGAYRFQSATPFTATHRGAGGHGRGRHGGQEPRHPGSTSRNTGRGHGVPGIGRARAAQRVPGSRVARTGRDRGPPSPGEWPDRTRGPAWALRHGTWTP